MKGYGAIALFFFLSVFSPAPHTNEVKYIWCGALTPYSIKVNAKLTKPSSSVRLILSTDPAFSTPIYSDYISVDESTNFMASLAADDLLPGTKYHYAVESQGIAYTSPENTGSFTTPPGGPFSYSFAVAACGKNSDHPVYDAMRYMQPLFYLNLGDLHYEDPNSKDVDVHRAPYENAVLAKPAAARLFREVPLAYVWDDHDYCGNDSDKESIGKGSAWQAYREYVPHYPLPAGSINAPIYQAFTIGRVRFILTDLRSERSRKSLMGEEQKRWFKEELIAARNNNQLIAWGSSVPFLSSYPDAWGGFQQERKELGNFFRDNMITDMFILGGDAHMIAIDNGDNSDFSTGLIKNPFSYPVFQAAALNRPGSVKGGTYSHGTFPNPGAEIGQFGLVAITDNGGNTVCIDFKGYRVAAADDVREITSYSFCREPGAFTRIKVFPNPAVGFFNISLLNALADEDASLRIFDISGRLVVEKPLHVEPGNNQFLIELDRNLKTGIYFLMVGYGEQVFSEKLIIY